MKPAILCVCHDGKVLGQIESELAEPFGGAYAIKLFSQAAAGSDFLRKHAQEGIQAPVVIADAALSTAEREELLAELGRLFPAARLILLTGGEGSESDQLWSAGPEPFSRLAVPWRKGEVARFVAEAVAGQARQGSADRRASDRREGHDVDTLLQTVNAMVQQLEERKGELEKVFKELNVSTIQRLLIEREAEKMSRRLTALQNNLKNNLFIRSVLHSLINMLQVQVSLDKEQNALVREIGEEIRACRSAAGASRNTALERVTEELLPQLSALREKSDDNIHHALLGYVKAVQRSLTGERGFQSDKPSSLNQAVERVRIKYRELLDGEKTGQPVEFIVDLPGPEIHLHVFDFALINIIENLLTNSIRKVLEAVRTERWIRISAGRERVMNEPCVVIRWSDNGGGVPAERKRSIFEGDSDKTEEGDHGVGLKDVKSTVESVGGFIRETGVSGQGAEFVLGFPLSDHGAAADGRDE